MIANRLIFIATLALGLAGGWTLWAATSQYVDVARAYTHVTVTYQEGSYRWLDAEYENGSAAFQIENGSRHAVTLESLDLHLTFDGEFAGSNYERFEPVLVPAGESRVIEVHFQVTNGAPQAGRDAQIGIDGKGVCRFEGIKPSRGVDIRAEIGRVPEAVP